PVFDFQFDLSSISSRWHDIPPPFSARQRGSVIGASPEVITTTVIEDMHTRKRSIPQSRGDLNRPLFSAIQDPSDASDLNRRFPLQSMRNCFHGAGHRRQQWLLSHSCSLSLSLSRIYSGLLSRTWSLRSYFEVSSKFVIDVSR